MPMSAYFPTPKPRMILCAAAVSLHCVISGCAAGDNGASTGGNPPGNDTEGVWTVTAMRMGGVDMPIDDEASECEISDQKLILKHARKVSEEYSYTCDASGDPPTITLRSKMGREFYGILRVTGNKLSLCFRAKPNGERPTTFEAPKDSMIVLLKCQRSRPESKRNVQTK